MSRGAEKKNWPPSRSSSSSSSSPTSSWVASRSMAGFYRYPSSTRTSGKDRTQPPPAPAAPTQQQGDKSSSKKKRRSISIGRSITCAGSICSTKESSVMSRDRRGASSRSLRAPYVDVDVNDASAAAISATSSFNSETTVASTTTVTSSSSSSSVGTSFRGVHIRKLSGCYECHSVFDPRSFGAAAFPCADCDEVFAKAESLELHRATRHAVWELGPEDTSRNIVEIIFQSSWPAGKQQQAPVCKIERVLKVQSSDRTLERFEQYKESVRERASSDRGRKNNPRCVADGNELLRFHCTTFTCSLGLAGSTALCRAPPCKLCAIVRDGFRVDDDGKIATMGTSGRAHDMAQAVLSESDGDKRAMLVCRVVAGRVKKKASDEKKPSEDSGFDSVSPSTEGVCSDLDQLFVFNQRAILPCFVVIYSGY
ncbi:nucleic acid binding protein [Zea mays]|uniref:C2H2-like zinc finger protein n=1 Tax=Zea mays TaxID=4577 RepID=B4F949_MAIZE|nr:nucleic acid binding protein [Zea mays]ACF78642.1 unknown [Zea mays]AQK58535.1 C2H2-like zinc finger protein [Zea mays]|eukprot:NP_001130437.1 nucleic acid binding protein [Zea mays]